MNDIMFFKEAITSLQGKPANYVTSCLKTLGGGENGTMAEGLYCIINTMEKDKLMSVAHARAGGIAIGAVFTCGFFGIIHLLRYIEKKQSQKKIQEIAEILKQDTALINEDELTADEGTESNITEED